MSSVTIDGSEFGAGFIARFALTCQEKPRSEGSAVLVSAKTMPYPNKVRFLCGEPQRGWRSCR